jgi:uncharacterized membrane protein (DUF485 family)
VSDRLPRKIRSTGGGDRYGTWELSDDRRATEESPDDSWEARIAEMWGEEPEEEVARLIVRQRRLSVVATVIVVGVVLIAVTLGHLYPEAMSTPVWRGFSPAFLIVGVLIYPLTWIIALLYVLISNRMDGLS